MLTDHISSTIELFLHVLFLQVDLLATQSSRLVKRSYILARLCQPKDYSEHYITVSNYKYSVLRHTVGEAALYSRFQGEAICQHNSVGRFDADTTPV